MVERSSSGPAVLIRTHILKQHPAVVAFRHDFSAGCSEIANHVLLAICVP